MNRDANDDKFTFHAHEKYVHMALFISIYRRQYKITEDIYIKQADAFEFNVRCQKVTNDDEFRSFG